jgi:TM2 domain-containing membrane protein YozV
MFAAYMGWFLFGCLGAHRFYLGYTTSGAVQAMMSLGAAFILFMATAGQSLAFAGLGLFLLGTLGLWLLADLSLIPSMCERANTKLRRSETKRGFALD